MKIESVGAFRLIGFRVRCEGERYAIEIPRAASQLRQRCSEIQGAIRPERFIGAFIVGEEPPEKDGYWIGVEAEPGSPVPEGMTELEVPARRYAVSRHDGDPASIRDAYAALHAWMEAQSLERDLTGWHLEISTEGKSPIELYDTIR